MQIVRPQIQCLSITFSTIERVQVKLNRACPKSLGHHLKFHTTIKRYRLRTCVLNSVRASLLCHSLPYSPMWPLLNRSVSTHTHYCDYFIKVKISKTQRTDNIVLFICLQQPASLLMHRKRWWHLVCATLLVHVANRCRHAVHLPDQLWAVRVVWKHRWPDSIQVLWLY